MQDMIPLPPLPTPDTHCFDDDTGKDVWSHSAEQMQAYALAAIEAQGVPDLIAGALYDFLGHLTSMEKPIAFGATEWATPAIDALVSFAEKRRLTLCNPTIEDWTESLAAALPAPQPQPVQQEPIAYLDIGAGGYLDLATDLTDEQLLALPKGRHTLVIAGTFGIDGYTSPQAAQPLTPEWYARWIRNNYQDHPNIATLCEELTKAAHGITKGTT